MVTSSLLAVLALHRLNGRRLVTAALLLSPFIIVETVFLVANLTKIAHGGFVPLVIAAAIILIMSAWVRGTRAMAKAELRDVKLADVLEMLSLRPPLRARGAAVFLTANPESAPVALMHNLKHNQVLHEQVILLTVKVSDRPHVAPEEQVTIVPVAEGVKALTMRFGFMDPPNVTTGLTLARTRGLKFDIMRTSFFLSRRTLVSSRSKGFAKVLDAIFIILSRNAVRAADYFHIPVSRVVELGAQVVI
jgi:KUP system potassium uptake protein